MPSKIHGKVIVTFECDESLHEQVKEIAEKQDRSVSSAIRLALHNMLDNKKEFFAELNNRGKE